MKSGLQQQAIQTLQSTVTAVKTAYVNLNDGDFYVDENGNLIDGDAILAITSNYLKEKGQLKGDTVVATVMSNLGLRKYAQDNGWNTLAKSILGGIDFLKSKYIGIGQNTIYLQKFDCYFQAK